MCDFHVHEVSKATRRTCAHSQSVRKTQSTRHVISHEVLLECEASPHRFCSMLSISRRCRSSTSESAFVRAVVERMKSPDFIEATHAVERVQIIRVARGELA